MRIGIYSPRAGFSRAGGTETFLREMMKRLHDEHELVLYCGAGDLLDEVRELDVDVRQIALWAKESRRNALVADNTPVLPAEVESLSMYWHARRRDVFDRMADEVDVLSTHYYLDNLLASRAAPVPSVFHFPGIEDRSVRWRAMSRFATTASYLANSESTADRVREWLNLDIDGVVYPGVDLTQFRPDIEPAFEDERVAVLYVGRLDDGKGLFDLLEAQARLGTRTRLYLVGDGTLEGDLRRRADELGIEDDVRFVGAVDHEDVARYYTAADIFCLPSYHESFGMVNVEAMACGTPVVSTRIDAIEEYLDDGENGALVDPGDVAALTDALERLAESPELRDRLAANALDAASEFDWDVQADRLARCYERAC
ncbi:MAG: glycosyltransferase family 4 protein [Halarchaeum sp.]